MWKERRKKKGEVADLAFHFLQRKLCPLTHFGVPFEVEIKTGYTMQLFQGEELLHIHGTTARKTS